jgi:hypothetical protein
VNLFAGSQKIAIKIRHVMASSFARQDCGGCRLLVKEDGEHHEQVFGERGRFMWEGLMSTGLTRQGSVWAGIHARGVEG